MHLSRFFILSIVFLIGQNLYSQNKPGYFDYSKIEKAHPLSERIEDFKQAMEKHLNDSLQILQKNLYNEYTGHHQVYGDSAKRANMEVTLNKLNEDVYRFQLSAQERYYKELETIRSEYKNKAVILIKEYCTAKKIEVMVEKEAMIYCPDCKDYTDEIIEYISSINIK